MHLNSRNQYWPDGASTTMKSVEEREKIANLRPGILQKVIALTITNN